MKHLTVRQAIIGSSRSSVGLLARNARNLGKQQGFEVVDAQCQNNLLSAFEDNREWYKTLLVEDLGQAAGFTTLSNTCRFNLIKAFWP